VARARIGGTIASLTVKEGDTVAAATAPVSVGLVVMPRETIAALADD
jgi:hypothetical protein